MGSQGEEGKCLLERDQGECNYGLAVTVFKSVGGGVEGSHWSPRGVMITFGQGSLFSGAGAFYYSVSLAFSRSRTL